MQVLLNNAAQMIRITKYKRAGKLIGFKSQDSELIKKQLDDIAKIASEEQGERITRSDVLRNAVDLLIREAKKSEEFAKSALSESVEGLSKSNAQARKKNAGSR